jgi:hypothetical protein
LFVELAECAVPGIDVQFIGIDQGTVNIEGESEHGDEVLELKSPFGNEMR